MRILLSILLSSIAFSTWASDNRLQIVGADNSPIAGARVMIGPEADVPFQGNVVVTNENGYLPVIKGWSTPQPVSIEAAGFLRTSYMTVGPDELSLTLLPLPLENQIEVRGNTTDYGRLRRDGKVDFGLVLPALSRQQMIQFDIASIMSTELDEIKILSQNVYIPSNLSLPRQKESYFLPITLDKPNYRMYFGQPGNYRLGVTHGQFPLNEVVDDLRAGKSFFDVINYFDFIGGGEALVSANKSLQGIDLAVNQIQFSPAIPFKAPLFDGENYNMVGLALIEKDGELLPTDVKRFAPEQEITLKTTSAPESKYILSSLTPAPVELTDKERELKLLIDKIMTIKVYSDDWDDEEGWPTSDDGDVDIVFAPEPNSNQNGAVSLTLQSAENISTPEFLPLIEPPVLALNVVNLTPPTAPSSVQPFGTYLVLSEIEVLQREKYSIEIKHRKWEILAKGWQSQISLPQLDNLTEAGKQYVWEVVFLGTNAASGKEQNLRDLNEVTHATRNSVRF